MEISLLIKMKINPEVLNFAKVFILLDFCLIIYAFVFQNNLWLLNTQVAFVSSIFVVTGSFLSYKRNVENRLSNFDSTKIQEGVDRDKIDEIDDPFDLYSEYEPVKEEDLTPEKIKEIINDEKTKLKKNSIKNTIFSAGSFLSLYRISGYASLIFGFFALNNNQIFMPVAFIIGISVVPFGILISKLKK